MYLKKYVLSEKVVSDEILRKMFYLVYGGIKIDKIDRCERSIRIYSSIDNSDMTIWGFGSIYISDDLNCHIINASVFGTLLGTQWIDPNVKLPKDMYEKVIVKYLDGGNIFIITGFIWKSNEKHFGVGNVEDELFNTEYDNKTILGWLPSDNVVM